MTPLEFIEKLRYEFAELNSKILRHPFIMDAVEGKLSLDKMKLLISQQYYIASNDAKALAIMYSRSNYPANTFFLKLLESHQLALNHLEKTLKFFNIENIKPLARAVSYTHFLFHLAYFASIEEQIVAIVINFPVFIENINKIGKALKEKYNIVEASFFEEARWDKEAEFLGLKILEKYDLEKNERIKELVRLIQEYELEFWDAIYYD